MIHSQVHPASTKRHSRSAAISDWKSSVGAVLALLLALFAFIMLMYSNTPPA